MEDDQGSHPSENDSRENSATSPRHQKKARHIPTALARVLREGHFLGVAVFTVCFLWLGKPLWDGTGVPAWDAFNFYAAEYGLIADHARAGEFLLWNPWVGGGRPDGADPQVGALSPLLVGAGWITGGAPAGFMAYTLFIWWAGGVGFLMLARNLGTPAWAGLAGALAFTYSGFQTGHMSHTSVVHGMSFLPWIIWRLDRAVIGRRFVPALEAGALWGLAGLAAYPALTIVNGCVAGWWAFGRVFWGRSSAGTLPPDPVPDETKFGALLRTGLTLFLVLGVGLLVMAPAYLGFFVQFEGYDIRTGALPKATAVGSNALSWTALSTITSPLVTEILFINRKSLLEFTSPTSISIYLAIPVFLFSLAGAFVPTGPRTQRRWSWFLLATALFFLGLALGRDLPLRGWLYDVFPPSRYFRHAAKFRGYFLFFLLVLAMDFIRRIEIQPRILSRRSWQGVAILAAVVSSVALGELYAFRSVVRSGPDLHRGLLVSTILWVSTLVVIGILAFVTVQPRDRFNSLHQVWTPCLLLALVVVDCWNAAFFNRRLIYFGPETRYHSEWQKAEEDHRPQVDELPFARVAESPYWTHYNNLNSYAKVPVLRSYGSYFSKPVKTWFREPELTAAATGEGRFWFSEAVAVTGSSRDDIDQFQRRSAALGAPPLVLSNQDCDVDPEIVRPLSEAPAASRLDVEVLRYGSRSLSFSVTAPGDGWLMVTERFARGWTVRLDGRVIDPPCPAGFIFRGVRLPSGLHRLDMSYRPWGHPWLLAISWSLLAGLSVVSALTARNRQLR